ncbi:hypothetical protein SBA7_1650022 [Candidatus Sulfotelmatobacter sp. SbA7]|nr:hypothetical protein SBA7_1650022 [Candidatus Sulfotelmatobacter sp. SbA7]
MDYAVLHGLNRSVPKMDYLSGHAENNSYNLGSEGLTKRLTLDESFPHFSQKRREMGHPDMDFRPAVF